MRVQPHLPSRPFTATVIERSGDALCACSAAKSPAPPAPRIRMSVSRVLMGSSEAPGARRVDADQSMRQRQRVAFEALQDLQFNHTVPGLACADLEGLAHAQALEVEAERALLRLRLVGRGKEVERLVRR